VGGAELPPPKSGAGSYAEAVRRLDAALPEAVVAGQVGYWASRFHDGAPGLALPTDLRPAGASSYRGLRRTFALPADLSARLGALAAREEVTPYVTLLAALAARLHRDTGQTDLVLLTAVSRRHHAATRGVIGYFNNLLPLRLTFNASASFRDLVRVADEAVKGAFEHQDVPFQRLTGLPGLDRICLSRCFFSLQNVTPLGPDLAGVSSDYEDLSTDTANFDLAVFLEERDGTYRGIVDAKADLWSGPAVDEFVGRYQRLLGELAAGPDRPLSDLAGGPVVAPASIPTAGQPSDPPENELERRMIALWEEALGCRPLGLDSHFFELGGHSMLAARLFERIGREIGREVPLAALVRAPTVRQLCAMILRGDDVPCWASLVPIRTEGSRPPLFCVHGGGGGVLSYLRLADYLGPDQPLWGLQAPSTASAYQRH
jgi:non-ribosomal peptide synthetase component F